MGTAPFNGQWSSLFHVRCQVGGNQLGEAAKDKFFRLKAAIGIDRRKLGLENLKLLGDLPAAGNLRADSPFVESALFFVGGIF
jgi:hypothetical protein